MSEGADNLRVMSNRPNPKSNAVTWATLLATTILAVGLIFVAVEYARHQSIDEQLGALNSAVIAFEGSTCPQGWEPFSALGGRVVVGAGEGDAFTSPRKLGERGGTEQVSLTASQMPRHAHVVRLAHGVEVGRGSLGNSITVYGWQLQGQENTPTPSTNSNGNNATHENMPPWYALLYCQRKKISAPNVPVK